jgi:cytochrome P450
LQNKFPQTQEENFVEATSFLPERWLSNGQCPVHGAHNPDVIKVFGGGPRYCPGKNLAMVEMVMAISMICSNFDIELAVPADAVRERFSFTMFPENLKITLRKLEKQKVEY